MTITIQVSDVVPVTDGSEDPLLQTQNSKVGNAIKGNIGIENATLVNISEKSHLFF